MAKPTQAIKAMFAKFGLTLSTEQEQKLSKNENVDVPDELQEFFDKLLNDGYSSAENKGKTAGKAEAWNTTDTALKTLKEAAEDLGIDGAEFDAILREQGIDKKVGRLGEQLKTAKTKLLEANKSGTPADITAANKTIADLNKQIKKLETDTKTSVDAAVNAERERLGADILSKDVVGRFSRRKDVSETAKANRHFETMLKGDFEAELKKRGVRVDPFTQKVLKEDNTELHEKNEPVTIDTILAGIAAQDDWKKASDGKSPAGQVQLPGGNSGPVDKATQEAASAFFK